MNYKKEYYRLQEEVAKMLVVKIKRNYKTPMTPFELLLRWDKIREVEKPLNQNK